jgi:hypothetical protein
LGTKAVVVLLESMGLGRGEKFFQSDGALGRIHRGFVSFFVAICNICSASLGASQLHEVKKTLSRRFIFYYT